MTLTPMTPALREFISHEFHKVPEVAKFAKLGRNSVYTAVERGELKAQKFGSIIRVRTPDALAWLGIPLPEQLEQLSAEVEK